MGHPLTRPESRSVVQPKVDHAVRLMLELLADTGASREEDASRLRAIAYFCQTAAQELDPRDD
jgi:hypothetical protein